MKLGVSANAVNYQDFGIFESLDYAAQAGLDTIQLHRLKLKSLEPDYLRSIKDYADRLGLHIELMHGCIDRFGSNFHPERGTPAEQMRSAFDIARAFGSPVFQVFMGNLENRLASVPFEQRLEGVAQAIAEVKPLIEETGVRPAIENHGDTTARELAAFIASVGPKYVGVCLDTGNPTVMAEDPLLTVELLAPYTLMTAFRDSLVWRAEKGAMVQWVQMGKGNTDLPGMTALLKAHAPDVALSLEVITAGQPRSVPYLDPQATVWKMFPHTLAKDFARFVALAHKGPAGPVEMIWRPRSGAPEGELAEQLKAQQLRHYAESFDYCRQALGAGERRN
jgi:sugar phosphate isomerase/epimerase